MRFKQYLLEDLPRVPTSTPTSLDKAIKWARENAPNVMKRIKSGEISLLRGVDGSKGNYQFGDTSTFKRVSKNTYNYYTKFISTSSKWKEFPSRESAYICASNNRIASGYGDIFYVIPADNAKVGKCDSHDIWRSFPVLEKSIGVPGLNSLNVFLIALMKALDGKITPDTDASEIRETLRGWTLKKLYDLVDDNGKPKLNHQNAEQLEVAIKTMVSKGFANFEQLLEYCLDPKINNFTTSIADKASVPSKPGVEAWVEGKVLFVNEAELKDFLEEYFK